MPTRRMILGGGLAIFSGSAMAQGAHHQHDLFEALRKPGRTGLPEIAAQQWVSDSPAPKAAQPGRWVERSPLPLPRSEMAWAAEQGGRLHLVGGYGEQRVDRNYHHVYDQASDRWLVSASLPRGANHVGVATLAGKLYAVGGFIEQNRRPHAECFVYDDKADAWTPIASLPQPIGAVALVGHEGRLHAVGGAVGDTFDTRRSIATHYTWEPGANRWEERAPFQTARDHTGVVSTGGVIHLIAGRVDTFHTNSNLHHAYDAKADKWEPRAPIPTARSGHGAVLYRGKIFCMGGEGTNRVFGQNEAYDPVADRWEQHAPMPTPRHGLGAAAIGDFIHVTGGGPIMGGGVQSAVHEAFTLG